MGQLLKQIKARRKALGLKQSDMMLRVGISRQQYQHLESKGNPRLDTLELIAKGLQGEVLLIPQNKLASVKAILESDDHVADSAKKDKAAEGNILSDNPWKGIIKGDDK